MRIAPRCRAALGEPWTLESFRIRCPGLLSVELASDWVRIHRDQKSEACLRVALDHAPLELFLGFIPKGSVSPGEFLHERGQGEQIVALLGDKVRRFRGRSMPGKHD